MIAPLPLPGLRTGVAVDARLNARSSAAQSVEHIKKSIDTATLIKHLGSFAKGCSKSESAPMRHRWLLFPASKFNFWIVKTTTLSHDVFQIAIAAVLFSIVLHRSALASELIIPALEFRTGPYATSGIPLWSGFSDYLTLLNERDGGINGVKIKIAACETAYDVKLSVECYEKVKSGALALFMPSTPAAYELIPKVTTDHIPMITPGSGRTSAADGRVFPWIFNFPATYWTGASIILQYIADQERDYIAEPERNYVADRLQDSENLKGKRIGFLYLNSSYGREPIPIFSKIAKRQGFEFLLYPAEPPGFEQAAIWEQISRDRPDWLLLWGWGKMNEISITNAVAHGFPMGRFIGIWWSSSENDVQLAGANADGLLGAALHAPGAVCPVHDDVLKYVYDAGKSRQPAFRPHVGEVLYNRGLAIGMWLTEGVRKAMDLRGTSQVTPADVRDGFEALDLTDEAIERLGFEGMVSPMKITCANHEGPGKAAIQQWDAAGQRWRLVSRFYEPDRSLIEPMIRADSERYAAENGIAIRSCR
jgi:branched-chain amino acid transport system substrate-binding protein